MADPLPPATLYLVLPPGAAVARHAPPEGYSLRAFGAGDEEAWLAVMDAAFPGSDNRSELERVLPDLVPAGLFIAFAADGACVATAAAVANSHGGHRDFANGGELGEVAVRPEHRRIGLGRAVCSAAVGHLLEAGFDTIWTGTRDERLPAIALFLGLGFVPLLYECSRHEHEGPAMEERWRRVRERLAG